MHLHTMNYNECALNILTLTIVYIYIEDREGDTKRVEQGSTHTCTCRVEEASNCSVRVRVRALHNIMISKFRMCTNVLCMHLCLCVCVWALGIIKTVLDRKPARSHIQINKCQYTMEMHKCT